ncbi:sodium:solute symporter family protein [Aquimarina longa]|uniref:sodium:solute symporter family protein n=1 Tax=Aquimarina longa TaxID=1080221 RepID=UPI000780A698|nr:sodium:solute symporter family protein [Aquimarina longa]
MVLTTLDYIIIASFFLTTLIIGVVVSRRSGKNTAEYFLSGRNMPWWLLGFSMVATTFSTDTPNLVTDIVRQDGVAGNWIWWIFLLTGLLTVFVYAKLWRKSNVTTDMEFYSLRYSGKPARFLRGFRSIYLGVVFNIIAMAAVNLAAIKIGQIMLGLSPVQTVLIGGVVTAAFSSLGGFRGVIYTDFVLFFVAIIGAVGASYYLVNLPEVGGLNNLVTHPNVSDKLSFFPDFSNTETLITLLIIPIAIQWWSSWYPGAEPGGGGYIAQRMLAAKNENHAIGATFFFNIMHYALRPWPWILVALASLVMYPDIASIQEAFPNVESSKLGHDLAYSAMLTKLPAGLLGLVLASLGAAYMSTLSTHLNWGSSYVVNDFYKQQVKKDASEKELVNIGRVTTVVLMVASAVFALFLTNAKQLFDIILMFGAGTGLVYILRWFWWRINAWSEISVMFSAMVIPLLLTFTPLGDILFGHINDSGEVVSGVFPSWFRFIAMVIVTSIVWIVATYLTKPESKEILQSFYKSIQPGGPGWKKVIDEAKEDGVDIVEDKGKWSIPSGILAMLLGCVLVYSCLFTTGNLIYGDYTMAGITALLALVSGFLLLRVWKSLGKSMMS